MIKCNFCSSMHVPNTLFCRECGTYLLDDKKLLTTDSLGTEELGWVGDTGQEPDPISPEQMKQTSIYLKVTDSNRTIETILSDIIMLGRLDPHYDVFPEIDFTDDSGLEKGVSRRHAQIIKSKDQILVEDMGSLNGTFINGERLPPYFPEAINHGDQLQLGKLLIDVQLK